MKRTVLLLILSCAGIAYGQKVELMFNGNTIDNSGNSNNATNYGATLTTDRWGAANSAYQFDGINDYMTIPSSFDFANRTIQFWCMVDAITNKNQQVYVSDNANLNYGLTAAALLGLTKDTLRMIAGNNICDNKINADQWYFVALSVKNDSFYAYLDSVLKFKGKNNFHKSSDGMNLTVLGASRGANNSFWGGKIDDVRVYNLYKDPVEMKQVYRNEAGLSVGVKPIDKKVPVLNFSVSPNPVQGQDLNIHFGNALIQNRNAFHIYNSVGVLVYSGFAHAETVRVARENFSTGVYFIRMNNATESKTVQFIYSPE